MKYAEFNEALGRYAIAHPERRLSEVTAIEFAEWYYVTGNPHIGSSLADVLGEKPLPPVACLRCYGYVSGGAARQECTCGTPDLPADEKPFPTAAELAARKAPELGPVPPGSTLVVGARCRITEISPCDGEPGNKVGDVCEVSEESEPGKLEAHWLWDRNAWLVFTKTWVTGLERIA